MFARVSSTADRDHDLEPVTVEQRLLSEAAARHDLAIALQRNALVGEAQLFDQLGDGEGIVEAAPLAVDGERDHAMCSGR